MASLGMCKVCGVTFETTRWFAQNLLSHQVCGLGCARVFDTKQTPDEMELEITSKFVAWMAEQHGVDPPKVDASILLFRYLVKQEDIVPQGNVV